MAISEVSQGDVARLTLGVKPHPSRCARRHPLSLLPETNGVWSLPQSDTPRGGGKIPITTRSEKARTLFLEGRNVQEKLSAYPNDERAHNLLGNYFGQQEWTLAITEFEKAIKEP
jgi:hypothetical protein